MAPNRSFAPIGDKAEKDRLARQFRARVQRRAIEENARASRVAQIAEEEVALYNNSGHPYIIELRRTENRGNYINLKARLTKRVLN